MNRITESDLILNRDGSIYHLNLLPEDVASTVITVGDPDRVAEVTKYFDSIELSKGKREFITQTGYVGKTRITVLSTGIGTDNIDIVFNELDALVNIDFDTRTVKSLVTSLDIIRIGTSGAIQPDIPIGTILVSAHGLGLDTLMQYYLQAETCETKALLSEIKLHLKDLSGIEPYLSAASPELKNRIGKGLPSGITVTAPGFYAPQGRNVRAKRRFPELVETLSSFKSGNSRISNLEMETAGIYALAGCLGHNALSINAILVNRSTGKFSNEPQLVVNKAIQQVLEKL
jgi:uridine phosphorylase